MVLPKKNPDLNALSFFTGSILNQLLIVSLAFRLATSSQLLTTFPIFEFFTAPIAFDLTKSEAPGTKWYAAIAAVPIVAVQSQIVGIRFNFKQFRM